MAKLFSHHDYLHGHAGLGFLTLLHFLWRLWLVLRYGTSFPSWESKEWQTAGLMVHWMLSLSALQFPLPKKRNYNAPMLWPEFRLHSITFASRHIIGTLLTLWNVWPSGWPAMWAKLTLVLGTVQTASWVSKRFGDKDRRTTNAMPYPDSIDVPTQAIIKAMYAKLQFIATATAIMDGDATLAYWPLLAIQGAAFLMTLVRKGLIPSLYYHRLYALALMMPYPVILAMVWHGTTKCQPTLYANIAIAVVQPLRFLRLPAIYCWAMGVVLMEVSWHVFGDWLDQQIPHNVVLAAHVYFCIPFRFKVLLPYYNTFRQGRPKKTA